MTLTVNPKLHRMVPDKDLYAYLAEEIERDPNAERVECSVSTPGAISMFDAEFGREITFHTEFRENFSSYIKIGPDAKRTGMVPKITAIRNVLSKLDYAERFLMGLNKIFIVATPEDLRGLCDDADVDDELIPEGLFGEDDGGNETLNPELVGLHWFEQSIVVVNVFAIARATEELFPAGSPAFDATLKEGFWVTLLHEVRHNQVDNCPYELPWIRDEDASEDAVESWARATYERLRI